MAIRAGGGTLRDAGREAAPGTSCKEKTGTRLEQGTIDVGEQACGILPGDVRTTL